MANPFDQFDSAKPSSNPFDQFDEAPAKPSGALRKAVGDKLVGFASGAIGATKALTDAAGAGNVVSNTLDDANKGVSDYLSPEAKADQQEQSAIMAEAKGKGVWEGVKAGAKAFAVAPVQTAVQGLGSVVPIVAGTALTGGATPAAAVGAGIGVAMGAGTAKGAIYEEIKKRGGTDEEATQAQAYGGENTDQIALGGALGAVDALTGVSKAASGMVRGALRKPVTEAVAPAVERGIVGRAGMGMLGEMPLEAAQGGQEQVAANLAAQRAGYEAGTWDNVASNATLEALASAGPGAAFGAAGGQKATAPDQKPPAPLQIGNTPDPYVSFPDGTVARQSEVDAYINGLPPEQQPAARAKVMGLAPQAGTPEPVPPAGPPEQLGYSPLAGTPIVFPDGSVSLSGEQVFEKRFAPQPAKPSEQMGLAPTDGPSLANAAITAVDTGVHQAQIDQQTSEADQAAYDTYMAEQDTADKPITHGKLAEADMADENKRAVLFSNKAVGDGGQQWAGTREGDVLNGSGAPFSKWPEALRRARMEGKDWSIAKVDGGFVARRKGTVIDAKLNQNTPLALVNIEQQAIESVANEQNPATGTEAAPATPQGQAPAAVEGDAAATRGVPGAGNTTLEANGVDQAANAAATSPLNDLPQPTEAQIEAGNYKKGHIAVHGLGITIENPRGSTRSGKRPDGSTWSHNMSDHYGYVKRSVGADNEQMDVYVGPQPESTKVFVVDQLDQQTGDFDEHKAMLGYNNQMQAVRAYRTNFDKGWKVGAVKTMTVDDFKSWLKSGETKEPLAPLQQGQAATNSVAEATPAKPHADRIGRNNVSVAEDGKPFKTQKAAKDQQRLNPGMRVIAHDGGFVLAPKTEKQLQAEQNASRRLRVARTGKADTPIAAHEFIAGEGGLAKAGMADLGFDQNPRVGNRYLFAGKGGLTIEQASENLQEAGYLASGASHSDAIAMIKRSITQPQYTPEGVERMAEAERDQQYADHLAAMQEMPENEDPFGPLSELDYAQSDAELAKYGTVDREKQLAVDALLVIAEDLDIDVAGIEYDAALETTQGTQNDYLDATKQKLETAIAGRTADRRGEGTTGEGSEAGRGTADAGRGGNGGKNDDRQAQPAEPEGLTAPTQADILARQEAEEKADKAKRAAKAAADKQAAEDEDRTRIAKASEAAADTFELGGDAMANLTGQQDIFSAPAESATESKPVTKKPSAAELKARADLMAGLADLSDIIGDLGKANMMPEQRQKLMPVLTRILDAAFRLGYYKFKDAAKFTLDQIREHLGDDAGKVLTLDDYQGAYISMASGKDGVDTKRAVIDIEDMSEIENHTALTDNESKEPTDVSNPDSDLESDSGQPAIEPAMGDPVQDGAAGSADRSGQIGGQATGSAGRRRQGGTRVHRGGTPAGGVPSNQPVHSGNPEPELAGIAAGSEFGDGSGFVDGTGIQPDTSAAAPTGNLFARRVEAARKLAAQKAAEGVKVAPGIDNIRATLPVLKEAQQDDVLKVEARFAEPKGTGMLITNGTGTGKTFSGLGVVKRAVKAGKGNILIVTPKEKISSDWMDTAREFLGLTINQLQDTKDAGRGVVVTTYANLGENDALASRQWDMVVTDEAHYLMQDSVGSNTTYLNAVRALTYHPDGVYTRHGMLNREDINAAKQMRDQVAGNVKILNNPDTMDQMLASLRDENKKLEARARLIEIRLAKKLDDMKAEFAERQGAARPRMLALSATPFAYAKTLDWANGYLFDYKDGYPHNEQELGTRYNLPSPREYWYITNLGYRMRYGKLTAPDAKVDSGLMERQLNSSLKKSGALSGRMLDVDADYDRRFVLVDSAIGHRIDAALNWINDQRRAAGTEDRGFGMLGDVINEQFKYLQKRYLLEAIKATEVVPIVKQHLAMGRKVVVFHDYKKGGGFNPFDVSNIAIKRDNDENQKEAAEQFNRAVTAFNAEFKDLVESNLGDMDSPIEVFAREFPKALLINGDEKKKDLLQRFKTFQSDDSGPTVALVQSAMNAGWSGHDTTGKHQRVLINLGQPTAPTMAIQQEGRIYREGQVSNAVMRYLNTGTQWERWTFASTIAGRASTAENLGMGELARALKDSFIDAFEASDKYAPGHEGEGTGGKEKDKAANNNITAWDRAKTLYYANQKKTSRTKAEEGVDYYATPEPVGLKMVEFLSLFPGESAMEPSGGHGAIARWLPEDVSRTVIEPSMALRSRLAMVMNPKEDRIIDGTYEEFHIANKFHGIVMNPPFGHGGKTAMEHLAKAANQLHDGGRVVALIPTGPAADKQFAKWYEGASEKPIKPLMVHPELGPIYKGDTVSVSGYEGVKFTAHAKRGELLDIRAPGYGTTEPMDRITAVSGTGLRSETGRPASADMYMVANIKLPQSTFERAGTGVATRIVVLEKQTDPAKAPAQNLYSRDFTNAEDINDLFDQMELMALPKRIEPVEAAPVKPVKPAKAEKPAAPAGTPGTTQLASEAAPDDQTPGLATTATVTLDGTDYPVSIYTTNAGKALRGAWVPTQEIALRFGERTFQKRPHGWFVRERDFPALSRNQDPARSMQTGMTGLGLPKPVVSQIVDAIRSQWGNAPDIEVANNIDDGTVPKAVRKYDQKQRSLGAKGNVEGFYFGNKVYLMADQLTNAQDVIRVLLHETLGHIGLRGAFGTELDPILKQVAAMRRPEMLAKAKQYGLDLSKAKDVLTAAEEVLAEMAQTYPQLGYVQRAISAIRNWLRNSLPGFKNLELTNNDIIQQFILPARGFVERGQGAGQGATALSRAASQDQTGTAAFRKWFGDSKVVDADGKPLVVYHGSPDGEISEFSYGQLTNLTEAFFFSSSKTVAETFANKNDFVEEDGPQPGVTSVYLSIKNPAVFDGDVSEEVTIDQFFERMGLSASDVPAEFAGSVGQESMTAWAWYNEEGWAFDKLRALGFDGFAATEQGRPVFAAFNPTQIKSATGNNGDFDGTNPGIRFSRSIGDTLASASNSVRDVKLPAGYKVNDLIASVPGKLSWWHKTVGTQYNLAQRSPAFKRVFDSVQTFIGDVSYFSTEAADLAPNILPKLESWKDITKSPLSAEDTKALSAPVFEGTLTWARDKSGKPVKASGDERAGIVFTSSELKSLFNLTDKQVGLYQEFRKATDKSLANLAIADMLRFGGKDVEPIRDVVLESKTVGEAAETLRDYLLSLAEGDDRSDVLTDTANKMTEKGDKAQDLMDRGYAPLSRFGTYTLDVVDADGDRAYFGMFESAAEASKMRRKMEGLYPGAKITQGTVSEQAYKMFAGVSPETLELFGDMLGLEAQGDNAASQAFQEYLKLAKSSRSAMKRMIQRKGIAGFSEDAGRVLAGFVYSNARQTASSLHMGEMTNAANDIAQTQGELKDAAVKLVDYIKNPQEEAQAIRGLLFAQYIGGSIASAMVNMTQPLTMTFPWLAQYGGVGSAAKQMAAAVKDVGKKSTGDTKLDAALHRAEEDGTVSPQEVHQLMQQSQGRGSLQSGDGTRAGDAMAAAQNTVSRISLVWGKLFGVAEQFNRRVTFIAAYRTAIAQGMADPDAFARQAISETQGVYNKGNKPAWARGAVGSTLFTFKQYSISYVEMLSRMAKNGPEGKKAALLALAVLFLVSGAGGMPGADDLDDLISGAMQGMGYNFDSKMKRKEFFVSLLGEGGAQFMERGVSGLPGVPIDVSGRMGLGNLIPGTGLFVKKADHTRDVAEIAGPAGDLIKRGFDAAGQLVKGDLAGAVNSISPKAIQNLTQAYDMANRGMYRDAKGMKVLDTDLGDAAVKAIGFQPNDVKRAQDANFEVTRMIGLNKITESEIANRWALGIFEKDAGKIQEARDDLAEWNRSNPESPIRINFTQIRSRVQKMNETKAERIAKTAPKEIRNAVRKELVGG